MSQLPETGFLRLPQIIGAPAKPNANPPKPAVVGLIPVSKSTWWAGVKSKRFPAPYMGLGPNTTAWRCEDIKKYIESVSAARPT